MLRWWWILVVGGIGGAAGLAIDAAPRFTGDELTVPPWVWLVVAVAGILIAVFLAFHDLRASRDQRIGELEDELASPDRLAELLIVQQDPRTWQLAGEAGDLIRGKYLSIKCTNRGEWTILKCKARIERLEYFVAASGRWIEPEWFSPLLLCWSYNDGGGAEMDIGTGSNRTFDLVAYQGEKADAAMIIAAEDELRDRNTLQFGRWRITCNIEADDCIPLILQTTLVWETGEPRNLEFIDEVVVSETIRPIPGNPPPVGT